jgi:hypothetical protein
MTDAALNQPRQQKPVRIIKPELSIHKKLGGIKFSQAFDSKDISSAENVVANSKSLFLVETAKDFLGFKNYYNSLDLENLTKENYEKLSALAFSIKSRAGTGGFPLASEVTNSLYQFCDKAAAALPKNGHRAVVMHFMALTEILEGRFEVNNQEKASKLVNGLNEVSKKFLA